jgi:hypothetical protein
MPKLHTKFGADPEKRKFIFLESIDFDLKDCIAEADSRFSITGRNH